MVPQGNGTVFIGQTDMLKLFEVQHFLLQQYFVYNQ